MPRTKTVRANVQKETILELNKKIEDQLKRSKEQLKTIRGIMDNIEKEVDSCMMEEKMSIPHSKANRTFGEWQNAGITCTVTYSDAVSMANVLSNTKLKNGTVNKSRQLRRSNSLIEDEGYLTAGSTSNGSGGSTRRSRSRQTKTTRVSRSLSRSKVQKPAPVSTAYKTPANKRALPSNFGTITPKMKPNTPQVVLRRPKQGEMAVSMQGSPLLVSGVVNDNVANVNIPLADGRMISIQPQRGLRPSQLPSFDLDTRRQIEALRDNLNKVCALAAARP